MAKKKKYSYIERVDYFSVQWGKRKKKTDKAFCAGYVDAYHRRINSSEFKTSAEKEAYQRGVDKSFKAQNKAHSLKW